MKSRLRMGARERRHDLECQASILLVEVAAAEDDCRWFVAPLSPHFVAGQHSLRSGHDMNTIEESAHDARGRHVAKELLRLGHAAFGAKENGLAARVRVRGEHAL